MYFITDEPKLINLETGTVLSIEQRRETLDENVYSVMILPARTYIYEGTRQECEDFIYALAGWVGAVNPMRAKDDN